MNNLGLYVHLPYCDTKCGYCDFFSVALKTRATGPLMSRVGRELLRRSGEARGRIGTVFVGGGTPTVLPIADFRGFFGSLSGVVRRNPVVEFTVEANPATLDDEKLSVMTEAGVDRLSMGAQSWHPEELAVLERLHSPDDIAPGVALARRHGIRNINLDLIFGIPGQTLENWKGSLDRTVDLGVEHIACYALTYEPETRLTALRDAGRMMPCDEGVETEMQLMTIDFLAANGYAQYEISNFARSDAACRHNLNYWRNGEYIGVGPSAAGSIAGRRYKNVADIAQYIAQMDRDGSAVSESELLTTEMVAGEYLLMQLRLNEGLSIAAFREATGLDPGRDLQPRLNDFVERGLIATSETAIALTRTGMLAADWIIAELYASLDVSRPGEAMVCCWRSRDDGLPSNA